MAAIFSDERKNETYEALRYSFTDYYERDKEKKFILNVLGCLQWMFDTER